MKIPSEVMFLLANGNKLNSTNKLSLLMTNRNLYKSKITSKIKANIKNVQNLVVTLRKYLDVLKTINENKYNKLSNILNQYNNNSISEKEFVKKVKSYNIDITKLYKSELNSLYSLNSCKFRVEFSVREISDTASREGLV